MLLAGFTLSEKVTLAEDIYSWGVLMMEMIGHYHPLCHQPANPKEMDEKTAVGAAYKNRPKTLEILQPRIDTRRFETLLATATAFVTMSRGRVCDNV